MEVSLVNVYRLQHDLNVGLVAALTGDNEMHSLHPYDKDGTDDEYYLSKPHSKPLDTWLFVHAYTVSFSTIKFAISSSHVGSNLYLAPCLSLPAVVQVTKAELTKITTCTM